MIYVDDLKLKKRQKYCHMLSDKGLYDLHVFALSIGVKRHWFHKDHYDLTPEMRQRAVIAGAKETASQELVNIRNATRRSKQENDSRS